MTTAVTATPAGLASGMASAWLVPLFIFVLVIVVAVMGLRWIRSEHLEALRAIPLFSLLSERELLSVLRSARAVGFAPGAAIIQEGEQGKGFFVITDGAATVTSDGAAVATLGAGSYFGEMSVLDGSPRSATITATEPVSTLEIGRTAFLHLLDREPLVARSLYEELERRLKAAGVPVEDAGDTRVTRDRLVELCRRLRQTQQADWSEAASGKRRALKLTSLFASGS
jgi:CRP-like cAMP-binding protein